MPTQFIDPWLFIERITRGFKRFPHCNLVNAPFRFPFQRQYLLISETTSDFFFFIFEIKFLVKQLNILLTLFL